MSKHLLTFLRRGFRHRPRICSAYRLLRFYRRRACGAGSLVAIACVAQSACGVAPAETQAAAQRSVVADEATRRAHVAGTEPLALEGLSQEPRRRNGCFISFEGPSGIHAPGPATHCHQVPSLPTQFYEYDWAVSDATTCQARASHYAAWCGNAVDVATHAEWIFDFPKRGAVHSARGAQGCEIQLSSCPADAGLAEFIRQGLRLYDAFAPPGREGDPWVEELACLARASDYAEHCRLPPGELATSVFHSRGNGGSRSVSNRGCVIQIESCSNAPTSSGPFVDPETSAHESRGACLARPAAWLAFCANGTEPPGSGDVSARFYRGNGTSIYDLAMAEIPGCSLRVRDCPGTPASHGRQIDLDVPPTAHVSEEACLEQARQQLAACAHPRTSIRGQYHWGNGTLYGITVCDRDVLGPNCNRCT